MREVKKLSEVHNKFGSMIDVLVDTLRVNCVCTPGDLTVAVTTKIEADEWTPGWAQVWFLFLFIEKKNDLSALAAIVNSPQQITWLIANFDSVYALMCDDACVSERSAFFEFQERESKAASDRAVEAFKAGRVPPL